MAILSYIKMFFEFIGLVKNLWGFYKQAKENGWINDGKELVYKVKNAKNDDERRKLAIKIAKHIRSMP